MLYSLKDLTAIIPELILTGFAFAILLIDLWLPKRLKNFNGILALFGVVFAFAAAVVMYNTPMDAFNHMIVMDRASNLATIIMLLTAFVAIVMSFDFLNREGYNLGEYYEILLFSLVAMIILASTYNLIVMFIAVETLSIGMYILTGFLRHKAESVEGAMKYFILGSFASTFLVLGIGLFYGMFGSVDLLTIKKLLGTSSEFYKWLAILAFLFVFVGFGFKIAAFPFHSWTPDVYASAPTPMSAFMSVAPKAASFLALLRFVAMGMGPIEANWTKILWVIAVATMTFGNTVALWQKDLKRLLGYSSIAHAGYMLVGITAANALGYGAVMFYLFGYLFMNLGAFAVAEFISQKDDRGTEIENLKGFGYRYPLLGAAMLIFMFCLAGVPPTVGFVGKYYLFSAAVKSHLYWLAVIGVINSAISAYFYLNIVVTMYMKEEKGQESRVYEVFNSIPVKAVILITALSVLYIGIFPSTFLDIALHSISF
ncbi:NADH-quinone oxidoreductase subunit N [Hippea jasoniae]|uniref:NADH-quinone oxidoreductase subunit N n=1 Tax=Hippea jasoniae TaxID=944479 RepID=UPI0005545BFB|nr:NADH-quinone oxidoreductase subunit N [Hippea jasoniae]